MSKLETMKYFCAISLIIIIGSLLLFNSCLSDNSIPKVLYKDYVNSSMIYEPIVFCISIDNSEKQICEYIITSSVNDSYYSGLCVLDRNDNFDSEKILKLNFNILSEKPINNSVKGLKFKRLGSNEYSPRIDSLVEQKIDSIKLGLQVINVLQGYSSVNCRSKVIFFESIKVKGDSIIIDVVNNKNNSSVIQSYTLSIPKYSTKIISQDGVLEKIVVKRIITETGYLCDNCDDVDSNDPTIIRCIETLNLTPNKEIIVNNFDWSGSFMKK